MDKVVVAVLDRPEAAADLLSAAARLLTLIGGDRVQALVVRVQALVVRVPPIATIMPTEEVLTAEREAEIRAEQETWAGRLKTVFDTWLGAWLPVLQQRSGEAAWVDIEGDLAEVVAEHGRRAEAVVVAQPVPHGGVRARRVIHAALFETGKPVLVVPAGGAADFGDVVAIAWKEDTRAPKAALAGMPILRHAERVHVVCAIEQGDARPELPAMLREHGIAAELHAIPARDGSTGEQLLDTAHRLGADMLVMGAYGHGEWREALFGGVTRHMLGHADLPVLMRH